MMIRIKGKGGIELLTKNFKLLLQLKSVAKSYKKKILKLFSLFILIIYTVFVLIEARPYKTSLQKNASEAAF